MRIVSLVPSITETLFAAGAGKNVAGVTDYCIHPAEAVASLPKVGGTKTVDEAALLALKPELVIANREENVREQVEKISTAGISVWLTDIVTISDVLDFVEALPERAAASRKAARELCARIKAAYEFCQTHRKGEAPRAACLIWRKPYMGVGRETYMHHLMEAAGGGNVFAELPPERGRYPETTPEEMAALRPELFLLPSEPYPFDARRVEELRAALPLSCPAAAKPEAFQLVSGEDMCWFGARTPEGLRMLYKIFSGGARWSVSY